MNTIKEKLKQIGYESPYEISKKMGCPKDYCEFIKIYSGQELSSIFRLYSFPMNYQAIYGREIPELEGMLVFGSDLGEYVYAFDTKNNWEVVDIDADGNIVERYGDFKSFINGILDEIIESMENE